MIFSYRVDTNLKYDRRLYLSFAYVLRQKHRPEANCFSYISNALKKATKI